MADVYFFFHREIFLEVPEHVQLKIVNVLVLLNYRCLRFIVICLLQLSKMKQTNTFQFASLLNIGSGNNVNIRDFNRYTFSKYK